TFQLRIEAFGFPPATGSLIGEGSFLIMETGATPVLRVAARHSKCRRAFNCIVSAKLACGGGSLAINSPDDSRRTGPAPGRCQTNQILPQMTRRSFSLIFGLLFLFLSTAVAGSADPKPRRPNILWLIAEDFGQHLGCYGTKEVWTPNLDHLAEQGVRYTRFFTTAPVCSPSRSAFMTGMYQTTIGAHNHRSHRDDGYELPKGVRVLTDWLRDAGYFTANVRELPAACGFPGTGKTDWNFTYKGEPFDSAKW